MKSGEFTLLMIDKVRDKIMHLGVEKGLTEMECVDDRMTITAFWGFDDTHKETLLIIKDKKYTVEFMNDDTMAVTLSELYDRVDEVVKDIERLLVIADIVTEKFKEGVQ